MKEFTKLLEAITKNKKYRDITLSLIQEEIKNYFKTNPTHKKFVQKQKSKNFKKIVSAIRTKLHALHGSFQTTKKNKRTALLQELKQTGNKASLKAREILNKILATNISTKERLKDYPTLYKKIFSITGKPTTILDLGAGINPLSYPYMQLPKLEYHAYDIDEQDKKFLNTYFSLMKEHKLKGKASILNLLQVKKDKNFLKKLPKADIAFLLKLLDPLERGKGHKLSEIIITTLPAKYLVVSFSTKTVSDKPMKHPYRGWIERMLERLSFSYKKITLKNEVFYIIKRNA